MIRTPLQKIKDFLSFPLRAVVLFDQDLFGLSSLMSERFDYVARKVQGYCLDVGCGRCNRFVREYLRGRGRGIDVFAYEGLTEDQLVEDLTHFPFNDGEFATITFIASINHVPRSQRDLELAESYRCLKPGGNIILTMGNPLAEILVHRLVHVYDRLFGTHYDVDTERGMHEEEEYYLTSAEITTRLYRAGFQNIRKEYFWTQWWLNHLFVAEKPPIS